MPPCVLDTDDATDIDKATSDKLDALIGSPGDDDLAPIPSAPMPKPSQVDQISVDADDGPDGADNDDDDGVVNIDTSADGARSRGDARALLDIAAASEADQNSDGADHEQDAGDDDTAMRASVPAGSGSEAAADATADSSQQARTVRAKVNQYVLVPREDGSVVKMHKQRYVAELNILRPRTRMSNDRLTRVAASMGLVVAGEGEADSLRLGLGTDFAMAFQDDDGKLTWALGRCQRMVHIQGRKKTLWRRPLVLTDGERPNVAIYARWYSAANRTRTEFRYNLDDSNPYLLQHLIAVVDLERDPRTAKYSLASKDRETLDAFIARLDASQADNASAGHVAQRARQSEQARQDQAQMQGAIQLVDGGVTRSGRQVRQRVAPGSVTAAPNVANGGRPSDAGFVVGAGRGGGASSKPKKKGRAGGKR